MEKVYVITGATSGIGLELVKYFSRKNKVFAGFRREECAEMLKSISDKIIPFYIDMEISESIKNAAEFIKSNTDKIDTLINVAGCVVAGVIEKLDINDLRKQFEVNTFSHLDFTQRLISGVKPNKIINVSSMASYGIFPFVAPYCASKRALDILFNSLSIESDVNVVSVKPGVIATPLWDKSVELNKKAIENCEGYEKEMKYLVKNAHDNGKNGLSPQRVVDLIAKIDTMKSPKPSYTVGFDAKVASIVSRLPFSTQKFLIKLGLKLKKMTPTK